MSVGRLLNSAGKQMLSSDGRIILGKLGDGCCCGRCINIYDICNDGTHLYLAAMLGKSHGLSWSYCCQMNADVDITSPRYLGDEYFDTQIHPTRVINYDDDHVMYGIKGGPSARFFKIIKTTGGVAWDSGWTSWNEGGSPIRLWDNYVFTTDQEKRYNQSTGVTVWVGSIVGYTSGLFEVSNRNGEEMMRVKIGASVSDFKQFNGDTSHGVAAGQNRGISDYYSSLEQGSYIMHLAWTPPANNTWNSAKLVGSTVWSQSGNLSRHPNGRSTRWLEKDSRSDVSSLMVTDDDSVTMAAMRGDMGANGATYNSTHLIAVNNADGEIIDKIAPDNKHSIKAVNQDSTIYLLYIVHVAHPELLGSSKDYYVDRYEFSGSEFEKTWSSDLIFSEPYAYAKGRPSSLTVLGDTVYVSWYCNIKGTSITTLDRDSGEHIAEYPPFEFELMGGEEE